MLLACVAAACGRSGEATGAGGSAGSAAAPAGSAAATAGSAAATAGSAAATAPAIRPPRQVQAFPAREVLEAPRLDLPKEESFRLLAPGAAPRARLRYRLADEPVEQIAETRLSSRTLDGSGQLGAPLALPPIREGLGVRRGRAGGAELALRALPAEIGERSDVGAAAGGSAAGAAGAAGAAAGSAAAAAAAGGAAGTAAGSAAGAAAQQYVAAWRAQLQNRRATVGFDDRGRLGPIRFDDDPTGARGLAPRDELAQRLLAVTVPLPEEPVGAGARWEVVTVLRQGPLFVKQTARYTLAARRATAWQIHVELRRVAEEQTVRDPAAGAALPRGAAADLLAMFRRLEGDVVVDPRRPLIERGALAIESRLHVRLRLPGRPPAEQLSEDTGALTLSTRPQPR